MIESKFTGFTPRVAPERLAEITHFNRRHGACKENLPGGNDDRHIRMLSSCRRGRWE